MKAKRLLLGNLAILSGLLTCITLSAFAPTLLAQQSISLKKDCGNRSQHLCYH